MCDKNQYIDIYIYIQMGLQFLWEGMAPKCRWSRNLYIYTHLSERMGQVRHGI